MQSALVPLSTEFLYLTRQSSTSVPAPCKHPTLLFENVANNQRKVNKQQKCNGPEMVSLLPSMLLSHHTWLTSLLRRRPFAFYSSMKNHFLSFRYHFLLGKRLLLRNVSEMSAVPKVTHLNWLFFAKKFGKAGKRWHMCKLAWILDTIIAKRVSIGLTCLSDCCCGVAN